MCVCVCFSVMQHSHDQRHLEETQRTVGKGDLGPTHKLLIAAASQYPLSLLNAHPPTPLEQWRHIYLHTLAIRQTNVLFHPKTFSLGNNGLSHCDTPVCVRLSPCGVEPSLCVGREPAEIISARCWRDLYHNVCAWERCLVGTKHKWSETFCEHAIVTQDPQHSWLLPNIPLPPQAVLTQNTWRNRCWRFGIRQICTDTPNNFSYLIWFHSIFQTPGKEDVSVVSVVSVVQPIDHRIFLISLRWLKFSNVYLQTNQICVKKQEPLIASHFQESQWVF